MTAINTNSENQLEIFREYGVKHLFHMTSLDNLSNIMSHGLYSHNLSHQHQMIQDDISNQSVNKKRAYIRDPYFHRSLHDNVPFFINPRNAMLYALRNRQCRLAILAISINALSDNDYLFTDGNAASYGTSFYNDPAYLSKLNWNAIRATYWNDIHDGRRIINAEFLIPDKVEVQHISGILLYNSNVEQKLKSSLHHPESVSLKTYPQFFFR